MVSAPETINAETAASEAVSSGTLNVEIAYALKQRQSIIVLNVDAGTTVAAAIEASGILSEYTDIDLNKNKVGIFGKATALETVLHEGDRVEIYRPLIADPKEVRRKRADEGKTKQASARKKAD